MFAPPTKCPIAFWRRRQSWDMVIGMRATCSFRAIILEALKALLPYYAGQVKCIYIDPPYNTGAAFEHYNDNLEHSMWLAMMWPRLELLRELLAEDGSIWVSIDDREGHYLKVIMDQIFGRSNFLAICDLAKNLYYQKFSKASISDMHDFVFCFAKDCEHLENQRSSSSQGNKIVRIRIQTTTLAGSWKATPIQARNYDSNGEYEIENAIRASDRRSPFRYHIGELQNERNLLNLIKTTEFGGEKR